MKIEKVFYDSLIDRYYLQIKIRFHLKIYKKLPKYLSFSSILKNPGSIGFDIPGTYHTVYIGWRKNKQIIFNSLFTSIQEDELEEIKNKDYDLKQIAQDCIDIDLLKIIDLATRENKKLIDYNEI